MDPSSHEVGLKTLILHVEICTAFKGSEVFWTMITNVFNKDVTNISRAS